MPLTSLGISDTSANDLAPLEGMTLGHLSLTPPQIKAGIEVLRGMKSLKTIHFPRDSGDMNLDPASFWKKYDAGEFGKK